MQKVIGSLIVLAALALLFVSDHLPILSHLFHVYWLRAGGGALALLGIFLIWADRG
ncbi:MAG: hypothetical protein ABI216_19425 [Devosia sp.]